MLDGNRLRLMCYRLFNGDNMHADTCTSGRYHRGDLLKRKSGHVLEELRNLGILIHGGGLHVKEFGTAGNKQGNEPLLMMILVLPVVLENAEFAHFLELCFKLAVVRPSGELLDLIKCQGLTLGKCEKNLNNLIVKNIAQTPILGIGFGELLNAELLRDTVRKLFSKLEQIFFVCYHAETPFGYS